MLIVCRFTVSTSGPTPIDLLPRARRALELLTAAAGCRGGELGRAVDDPDCWVLTVRFTSVDAYRRALSPFEVREQVVPLLAEADPEISTFETLVEATGGEAVAHQSLRAE